MSELPVVLFLMLRLLAFPMIDIATIGMRCATVFGTTRDAARAAGRARTYQADSDRGLSALKVAKQKAAVAIGHEVKIDPALVKVWIVGTPLKGGTAIRQDTPLAKPDASAYVYQIEVELTGVIDPLVTLDNKIFGDVPGLTIPITLVARNSEMAEHPLGLSK